MGNGDDCAVGEFTPDSLLYLSISVKVHAGSGLINTDHLGPRQQGSG